MVILPSLQNTTVFISQFNNCLVLCWIKTSQIQSPNSLQSSMSCMNTFKALDSLYSWRNVTWRLQFAPVWGVAPCVECKLSYVHLGNFPCLCCWCWRTNFPELLTSFLGLLSSYGGALSPGVFQKWVDGRYIFWDLPRWIYVFILISHLARYRILSWK